MTDSQDLLAEYRRNGSDAAFRELATRFVDLVHSTALRLVEGDTHRAEDVTQTVFVDLARLARTLSPEVRLGGWLHRHTCFVAVNTLRGERRRQARERQAVEMNTLQNHSEADFSHVAPLLDEAINELGEADRTAILLRFYEQQDFRAVGQTLGSNEDAARMRVTRALEKLEGFLKRRGVTTSAASLGVVLTANAVQAAPVGLAVTISTAAALAGTTLAATATATAVKTIAMTTLHKTIIAVTLAAAGVAVPIWQQARINQMTGEKRELQAQADEAAALRQEIRQLRQIKPDHNQATGSVAPHLAVGHFDWRMVESEDYRKYIANLRAIGCPEETIRDIVRADVNKLFESRRAALQTSTNKYEYWKPGAPLASMLDKEQLKQARELAKGKRELLTELLGAAPDEKQELYSGINPYEKVLDFLPAPKLAKVVEAMEEYQIKRAEALPAGIRNNEEFETWRKLQLEEETGLAQILTPQELEDYLLRMSNTANRLRSQITGFQPTEQEFREMFNVMRQFDDVFGRRFDTPAERERQAAAEREQEAQFKRILGEQRYQEYYAAWQKSVMPTR